MEILTDDNVEKIDYKNKIIAFCSDDKIWVFIQVHNRASVYAFACISDNQKMYTCEAYSYNSIKSAIKRQKEVFAFSDMKEFAKWTIETLS